MKQRRNIWFALQTTDSFHQASWRYKKNGKRKCQAVNALAKKMNGFEN